MKLAYRVHTPHLVRDENFEKYLDLIKPNLDIIDEITVFTEPWHYGYYPLHENVCENTGSEYMPMISFEALCGVLKKRIVQLKALEVKSVGVNMLVTIGHVNEAYGFLPGPPFSSVIGHDGSRSKGVFCLNTEEHKKYIEEKYALLAETNPDFIWVDDDVRSCCQGVDFSCFCPDCMKIFNDRNHTVFSREELVNVLNSSDGGNCRELWVEHNTAAIENLLSRIERAVHGVNQEIKLGFMSLSLEFSTYYGCDLKRWYKALKAEKARPGEGFYNDRAPLMFNKKAIGAGRQCSACSGVISDIQYELENFPYQKLLKSVTIFQAECTAAIAYGCNGVLFNILKQEAGTLEEYPRMFDAIREVKGIWRTMTEKAGSYRNAGLFPALSPMFDARRNVEDGNWFIFPKGEGDVSKSYVLNEIGIPFSADPDSSCGTILSGNMAEGYTNEQLIKMLKKGVFMDGRSLEILTHRGLERYCGVVIEKTYDNGTVEVFTGHELNGKYAGEYRDARQSFYSSTSYALRPIEKSVQVVSKLQSYTNDHLGAALTIYENSIGGRVAISGYSPWQFIYSAPKKTQLLNVCDYICRNKMPVRLEENLMILPVMKMTEDNKNFMLLLINGSLDHTGRFGVKLRADAGKILCMKKGVKTAQIKSIIRETDGIRAVIDDLAPFEFTVLFSDN